jgi:hypothetical protein
VGIIEAVASLRKGIRCSELQKVHLKMAETAKKHVRDVKAAVKIEEIAPFWLCSPKYMYKIEATEPRLSNLAGENPAWKGSSHATNSESWNWNGNIAV